MTMFTIWTDERVELLKTLHAEGLSAREIANRLACGCTRSAIIGKIHRLGLHRAGRMAHDDRIRRVLKGKGASLKKERARKATAARVVPLPSLTPIPLPPEEKPASVVKFEDLAPGHCRYGHGDPRTPEFGFCGKPKIEGLPYCAHHVRVCYAEPVAVRPRRIPERVPTFADAEREDA